jgi:outer membrane protein
MRRNLYTMVGWVVVITAVIGMSLAGQAAAQELKIGFVDLQRVIDASEKGQEAQADIQRQADALSEQAKQLQQEIEALKQDYQNQKDVLTPEARSEKRDEISKKEVDYKRFVNDSQTELRTAEQRALKKLLEEVGRLVVQYGQEQNFTMIFEAGNILYGAESVDLTEEIIEVYNAQTQ